MNTFSLTQSCYRHIKIAQKKTVPALQRMLLLILFLFFMLPLSAHADAADIASAKKTPVRLGLIPHLSNNLMMKKYQNLITHLEEQLQRPVIINTAPDFKTYVQRSAEGRFDLYMTAPHMAAYHEKHNQHFRLARFSNELRSVVLVRIDSSYKDIQDLKGKTISAPDALAMNTLNGEITLQENGLDIKNDIDIKYTTSNNNPLFLLVDAKVDAAITGLPIFNILAENPKIKHKLRILKKSNTVPHMMFMSPQRVTESERKAFQSALLNITNSETGKAFISNIPFGELIEVTDEDMQRLTGMLSLLEQRL